MVNSSGSLEDWQGLTNVAWGASVYYQSAEQFDRSVRDPAGDEYYGGRPMLLGKFGVMDWRPDLDAHGAAESPAHHRFPVWWTGDWVDLMGSVNTMVDGGIHGFKPYVHSDCGGDHRYTGGDLVRWVAHCSFGSIMRLHGNDHRPWSYDSGVEDDVREYLRARARLAPSLIAAGHRATLTAFPPVARGDFYWPDHAPDSADNSQYIFLDDLLVAPMDTVCLERSGSPDTSTSNSPCDRIDAAPNSADVHGWGWQCTSTTACNSNASGGHTFSSRSVWIPPGQWHDAWNGSVVTGPKSIRVTQPYHQQPMWHRAGGMVVLCDKPGLRVSEQDWSNLTLEIFPAARGSGVVEAERTVFERSAASSSHDVGQTHLRLLTSADDGTVRLKIGAGARGVPARAWLARIHLLPGQSVVAGSPTLITLDEHGDETGGQAVRVHSSDMQVLQPVSGSAAPRHFPLRGAGSAPPTGAGAVVEVALAGSSRARVLELALSQV